MNKIVTVIMGQNCERFLGMCLESVKDSDKVIFCDGGEEMRIPFFKYMEKFDFNGEYIRNEYKQDDLGMNGKQRNFYLKYVKEHYPDWWCLVLDCDEVVSKFKDIKKFINKSPEGVYSVKMRHFIGDLGHEDATQPEHFVLNRLFKVSCADKYPEVEHPVLQAKEGSQIAATRCTTIWHLAYVPNMWEIKKRYENHMRKSNMHTPQYLRDWYYKHLFGNYPKTEIEAIEIPDIILKEFGFSGEEFYYATHRTLELKHFLMLKQWLDKFNSHNILDLGCGVGLFGYVANYLDVPWKGYELTDWAVKNPAIPNVNKGDVTTDLKEKDWDLVLVLDVLEHLEYEDFEKTLENISKYGNVYIFSIPYLGDPNLDRDPTHIIKESKDWWVERLSKYFNIEEAPKEWFFSHQLLIGKPK